MYRPGGTIADALKRVQSNEYVLPAIQREFVWRPSQIERLFDSLMQGYPFGTFLFWKVRPATSGTFKFYGFVRDYHQRDAAHCPDLGALHGQPVTAVLDGQQRLTALNVGLRGTMATKLPYKWATSADAFPKRVLHLDLLAPVEPDEAGVVHRFQFLTAAQLAEAEEGRWFRVPDVLEMKSGHPMLKWVMSRGHEGDRLEAAFARLEQLHKVIHTSPLIHYYEEESQDLDRVLNIFIRLNSGGTVLSYSDLLLSVAVAQWTQLDARSEIHNLVDELNDLGFSFSQDFVLKAGLMLADIASVGFKVENFTAENMAALEARWPAIRTALLRTVQLAASFGLDGQTLRADSALLPIAYYLYLRGAPSNFIHSSTHQGDRERIRFWLIRSLLKASGIWGSALDVLLTALRAVIQEKGMAAFPVADLEREMSRRGKSIAFGDAEIEDLLDLSYGNKRTFLLLSLLFPFVDLKNHFHVDHVFPASRFTKGKLAKAGVQQDRIDEVLALRDSLPNLQLLEGTANIEKQAMLPSEWLKTYYSSDEARSNHRQNHVLGELPESLVDFAAFHASRREELRSKTAALLREPPPP